PAHKACAVAEAIAGDMVVLHLDDQFGLQRLPLCTALGGPATRSARRVAGEAWTAAQLLQLARQGGALIVTDRRGEADVVEQSLLVVEAEQQRSHQTLAGRVAKAADDAVGRAQALDLEHGPLARATRL